MRMKTGIVSVLAVALAAASWGAWALTRADSEAGAVNPLGRSKVELCVEVDPAPVGSLSASIATSKVKDALDEVTRGPQWRAAELDQYGHGAVSGRPGGYLDPPPNVAGNWSQAVGPSAAVTAASRFSTMVYVVGPSGVKELRDRGFGLAAREMMCEQGQHTCGQVTTALFISPATLDDPNLLAKALRFGLGIDDQSDADNPEGHPTDVPWNTKDD